MRATATASCVRKAELGPCGWNMIPDPPAAVSCMREALRSEGWDPAERRCPGLDWPKTAGPGLAVKARCRYASFNPPAAVSCMREALRSEGWDPAVRRCPGLDWPKTAGPGLAVKWIARSRFASSGLFHALLRSSCAWLAAHEKALPRSRQGDHQVPRTGLEPAQPFGHYPLKVACLPISPPGQGAANIAACHIRQTLLLHQPGNVVPRT